MTTPSSLQDFVYRYLKFIEIFCRGRGEGGGGARGSLCHPSLIVPPDRITVCVLIVRYL